MWLGSGAQGFLVVPENSLRGKAFCSDQCQGKPTTKWPIIILPEILAVHPARCCLVCLMYQPSNTPMPKCK